ncbi:MAG: helix-turn-helix transcriptional regulator, partial [Microbacteriaceae bacterium]
SDLLRARVQTLSCFSMCAVGAPAEALNAITSLRERNTLTTRGATALDEELQAAYHFCSLMGNGPSASHAPFRHRDAIRAVEHAPDETGMALGVALWMLHEGSAGEAELLLRRAQSTAALGDPYGFLPAVLSLRAEACALGGLNHEARDCLNRVDGARSGKAGMFLGVAASSRFVARFILGEAGLSRELLAAADRFCVAGDDGFAAQLLHVGVRFGQRHAAAALIELHLRLDGEVHTIAVRQARALLDDDPVALSQVARDFESRGLLVLAAEAFACAVAVARSRGLTGVEQAAAHALAVVLERCGVVQHPLLRSALNQMGAAALTPRERDILELIDRGLTNKEIAQFLRLSERTVEGHITRLYRKTGSGRRPPRRAPPA